MAWDEDGFRERIQLRAGELGLTIREVMRRAALPEDTFKADRRELRRGRTFNTIEKIAKAVDLTVPQALGYSPIAGAPIDRKLLLKAVALADRALRSDPERERLLPEIVAFVLDCLVDLDEQGSLNASAIKGVEAALKRVALEEEKKRWAGNPLSPFFDEAEPQRPSDPSPKASDPQAEDEPPPKMAMPDDSEHPLAA